MQGQNLIKKKADGSSYKFLIIDDSRIVRTCLRQIFQKLGGDVIAEADDGHIGVEKYKECSPDITTLDMNMPTMDGIETLKEILEYDKNALVVMVTTEGDSVYTEEAIAIGAKGFILKPATDETILECLNKII